MSQDQKPAAKRALSLDDLVNHDDDANKMRKTTDDSMADDNSDETDTDNEGEGKSGGVDFSSEMAFDYEKQDEPVKDNKASSSVNSIFDEKASLQSKKNNIKQDLRILNEIAATSKPNKYKNTPIWAQKWKPTVKALQSIDTKDFKIDTSFLNVIPDDDLTKSVQDWVYATIFSIPPDLRPMVEMELKYGIIIDSKSPDRISPPVSTQAIYTDDGRMTPNVDQAVFEELKKYIRGISELNENSGKFSVIESQTIDSLYRVGATTQRPRFLRMSTDLKTGRVAQFIEKRKVSSLVIYSPKDSYDMKLSINLEIPVPENEPPEKYKDQTPLSARTKKRVSYIHNDSCTRIDVTDVEQLTRGPKGRDTNNNTFEVELEINTSALLNTFDNITTDSNLYASLIRTFLNNGTLIRRKMSSLSYDIFEGQKKGM